MAEAAAGGLSLGTLTVQLAADVSALRKEFNKAFKETEKLAKEAASIRVAFDKAFGGVAHVATRVAGNLNQVSESINKVFGENGIPQAREFARSMGLTDGKIKGLETSLKGLSGVFSAVAMAAGLISAPIIAGIAAVAALILVIGAIKFAWKDSVGGIGNFAKSVWEFISSSLETAAIFWIDVFAGVRDAIVTNFKGIFEMYANLADAMAPIIGEKSAAFFKGAATYAVSSKGKTGRQVIDDFKAGGGIGAAAEAVVDLSMGLASSAADGIKQSWNAFGGPLLKDLMSGLMDAIPEVEKQAKSKALDSYDDAEEKRLDKLQRAFEKIAKEEEAIRRKEIESRERQSETFSKKLADSLKREADARANALQSAFGNAGSGRFGSAYLDYQRSQGGVGRYGVGAYAADQLGSAASSGQYTSSALQGAAGGAQAGGPWGAVVGAVIGLLTQSEGFKKIIASLEGILGPIAQALGKIVGPLSNVLTVVGEIIAPILEAIEPTLWSAAVAFNSVAAVLKLLVSGVNWVIYGIKSATNWLFDALAGIVDKIPGLGDVADWLRAQKMDAESNKAAAEKAWSEFKDAWSADLFKYEDDATAVTDLGSSASYAAASMTAFSESLTNLPSGYKVALARYNATTEIGGGAMGGQTNITINVNGGDAGETWKQIKKHMRRDGFLEPAAFAPVAG